jgi:hypothetical protein
MEYNEKVELQEVLEKARRFHDGRPRLAVSELTTGGGRDVTSTKLTCLSPVWLPA